MQIPVGGGALSFGALAGGSLGRLVLTGLIFVTAIGAGVTSVTGALFTDSDAVGGNTFSTGTVLLDASPTTAVVALSAMAPGDVDNGQMAVTNNGSLELRYAVTSTTTENTLAAQLDLTIWAETAEAVVDGTCAASAPGTVLYGPASLGSTAGVDVIGDPSAGGQAGDRVLAASAAEVMCFRAELPLASDNTFQGLTSTATLAFASEQTSNN